MYVGLNQPISLNSRMYRISQKNSHLTLDQLSPIHHS